MQNVNNLRIWQNWLRAYTRSDCLDVKIFSRIESTKRLKNIDFLQVLLVDLTALFTNLQNADIGNALLAIEILDLTKEKFQLWYQRGIDILD